MNGAESKKLQEEKLNTEDILNVMPESGKIILDDVATKLNSDKKSVLQSAKELDSQGLIRIKKHIFGKTEFWVTEKLIEKRKFDERRKNIEEIEKSGYKVIQTLSDDILFMLKDKKKLSIRKIAKSLKVTEETIEKYVKLMSPLVSIKYPLNIFAKPIVQIKKTDGYLKVPQGVEGKILSTYNITADSVPANIKIIGSTEESMPLYIPSLPIIDEGTSAVLDALADKLTDKISIEVEDISDPRRMVTLKSKFYEESKKLIESEINTSEENAEILAGILLHKTYGLGDIELLMNDDWLEEVCVNTSHVPLTAYHKRYGWTKTNLYLQDERSVYNYAAQIGRKIGRNITNLNPIMDAHLLTGDRVNASLFPISSLGNTITIRKFARQPWTITHFISPEFATLSKEIAAFLWLCIQYELSMIVGGGTASGKTSVLNCLLSLIQPTQRVISIEDTRELNLPKYLYWNWIPLTTREPNPEGKGEVSMLDLIVTSLRMRPDRIVLGEVRKQREAEVLFEAMHTGHSVYGTMHADTARNLKRRLLEPPIEIPSTEVEALQLILIQYRDRRLGIRKTFEVAEIIPGTEGKEFDLNYLFRYNARTHEFLKVNESVRVINELNLHTGMSRNEIDDDLKEKEKVLQWMLDNKIETIDEVGRVIDEYYKNKDELIKIVLAGKKL